MNSERFKVFLSNGLFINRNEICSCSCFFFVLSINMLLFSLVSNLLSLTFSVEIAGDITLSAELKVTSLFFSNISFLFIFEFSFSEILNFLC